VPTVGILAAGDGWHLRALESALRSIGCDPVRLEASRLSALVGRPAAIRAARRAEQGPPLLPHDLERLDGLLVRFIPPGSLDQIVFRIDCLHLLADLGLPVVNSPRAIERTVDKHWTSRLLHQAGVPTPATVAAEGFDDAMAAFREMRDVVVKPLLGAGGRGIMRIGDEDLAYRTFRTLEMQRAVFYLQEFVPHGRSDLRLFVAGGRLLAAARRTGQGWKTNVAAGATASPHPTRPEEEDLALRACHAVGADYAGVDLVEAEDGRTLVLEVNGIPGWAALQETTGVDLALEVARVIGARLRIPLGAPSRA
jgi:RimK family alpha-L-glutamate ligase